MADPTESAHLPELVRQVLDTPYCTDGKCWAQDTFEHKHTEGHGVVTMSFVAGVGFAVAQFGSAEPTMEVCGHCGHSETPHRSTSGVCEICGCSTWEPVKADMGGNPLSQSEETE